MAFITSYEKLESQNLISVVDVYDLAASIGKEFECIIDVFGVEAITNLMPKVISSLEMLENLAAWAERENTELEESRYTIQRLQREKLEKAQQKVAFEKEFEQYEDKWRSETQDLLEVISKLQSENRRLGTALQERDKTPPSESREEEVKLMTKMKASIDKQRDQIRNMKKDMEQKQIDNDALSEQMERLTKLNVELRRKHNVTSRQAKTLIEEKTNLQAQLQSKEQEVLQIKEGMHLEYSPSSPVSPTRLTHEMEAQLQEEGKVLIDMKDPNRPRFTLSELRDVILERNELKTKLIEVEEELNQYRPKDSADEDDDAPVHGPINREPYSKMYPDGRPGDSGIRRFFTNLFGRSKSPKSPKASKKKSVPIQVDRRGSLPDSNSWRRQTRANSAIYLQFPGSNLPI